MIRSVLYVPGDRPAMIARAGRRGADLVLIDLEDSVPVAAKPAARTAAVEAIAGLRAETKVGVRVNASPGELDADLAALAGIEVDIVFVPKATLALADQVAAAIRHGGLVALVESGKGLLEAPALAAHPRVVRLAVGEADLGADLGMHAAPDDQAWIPSRAWLVWSSAAADLDGPIGPVYTDLPDLDGLRESTRRLAAMGYAGRSAIHPTQIEVINEVFTPSAAELEAARRLVAAYDAALAAGRGVIVDDRGAIVDEAVVRRSRRLAADHPD